MNPSKILSTAADISAGILTGALQSRISSMTTIKKLTTYEGKYNIYKMKILYDYSLERIISRGIRNDQDYVDAIIKEVLPLVPVQLKAPDFGCSAFNCHTVDDKEYTGRNYDFSRDTSAMMVYCAPRDGYKSIGFAALNNIMADRATDGIKKRLSSLMSPFACLDGINEKGVCISVLTLESDPVRTHTGKDVITTTLYIRMVLDRAATTQEAIDILYKYDMFSSGGRDYHFFINDASGDSRVIEWDCEDESRQIVVLPHHIATNFQNKYIDKVLPMQKNGKYGRGRERYNSTERILEENRENITLETVWKALSSTARGPRPGEITSNTQWSVAYNNTDCTAEISLRRKWYDRYKFSAITGNEITKNNVNYYTEQT